MVVLPLPVVAAAVLDVADDEIFCKRIGFANSIALQSHRNLAGPKEF